jgi:hypothetical protein
LLAEIDVQEISLTPQGLAGENVHVSKMNWKWLEFGRMPPAWRSDHEGGLLQKWTASLPKACCVFIYE